MDINQFSNYSTHEKGLLCARLCQMAYMEDNCGLKERLCVKEEKRTKLFRHEYKSIQYSIFTTDTHQFLVIRGTDMQSGMMEAINDLWVSLRFLPVKTNSGIYCHKGYSKVGTKLINQLHYHKSLNLDKKLVIAGHSLGGAIAKYISVLMDREVEVFTYGAPQVSYSSNYFNSGYNSIETHYMNKGDWIPSYPSTLYCDKRQMFIMSGGNIHVGEVRRLGILIPFLSLTTKVMPWYKKPMWDEHSLTTYIRNLQHISGHIE